MTAKAKKSVQGVWGSTRQSVAELPRRTFVVITSVAAFAAIGAILLISSHAVGDPVLP